MLLHVQQGKTPASTAFPAQVMTILDALKLASAAEPAFGPDSRKIELRRR
jgi:hypothetical protein